MLAAWHSRRSSQRGSISSKPSAGCAADPRMHSATGVNQRTLNLTHLHDSALGPEIPKHMFQNLQVLHYRAPILWRQAWFLGCKYACMRARMRASRQAYMTTRVHANKNLHLQASVHAHVQIQRYTCEVKSSKKLHASLHSSRIYDYRYTQTQKTPTCMQQHLHITHAYMHACTCT